MEKSFKVGQKVELIEKGLKATIAYVGSTQFAPGKWVGVILDEPKGKNNGCVQGKSYFSCDDNHGLFVRQTQIRALDDESGTLVSGIKPPSRSPSFGSNTSISNIGQSSATTPTSSAPGAPLISTTQLKQPSRPNTGSVPSNNNLSVPAIQQQEQILTIPRYTQEDVDSMKAELKDLQEKFDTLRLKRAEDKAKIKDFEKTKIQLQQLQEFKKQITESQNELQKQLNQAKKEAKEAIEEKLKHAEEMRDLAETAEIATLDKEMAEEKYEQVARELEATKEKLEEVTLDLELLRNEIDDKGNDGVANSYQVKQLEHQNERLKEAIMKLRDLSAQDRIEIQQLTKEVEKYKNDCHDLLKEKEKKATEITELENQVTELKEQIDYALGAQEMVEILTEKNLELEDKNSKLQEEIFDLENLHDINEQLQENARETELELREEIDLLRGKLLETVRKFESLQETLADYEQTIQKFRDLVAQLREENKELRHQNSSNINITKTQLEREQQAENIEFKIRFAEAKAFSRAVEMDLRRLEVAQANEHIRLLSQFMPESFFIRGGDHDAIQVLLFVPRMIQKCDIISRQIAEKYPLNTELIDKINAEMVLKGNESIRQQTFVRKLFFLLAAMQTILNQYSDALKCCSLELYLKIASLLPELLVHEKVLDSYLETLKKDQFDETLSLDPIEKALNYFVSLYNLHLADGKINDCGKLLTNFVLNMKTGVDISLLDCVVIKYCLVSDDRSNEHLNNVFTYLNDVQQFCKKIKRRLVSEEKYKLTHSMENEIRDCIIQMNRVTAALHTLRMNLFNSCEHKENSEESELCPVSFKTLESVASSVGGFKFIEESLNGIMSICSQLCTGLQQGIFDDLSISATKEETKDPLEVRAQYIKAQTGQLNEIKIKLDAKEAEVSDLKRALKLKIEECSEMQIRRDIAEKKLQTAMKEAEEKLTKLQNEFDENKAIFKRKEKEFEDTMNHLQADIDSLELERSELKDKVKLLSKRTIFEGLTKSPVTANSQMTSSSMENGYIQQIAVLRAALQKLIAKNQTLETKLAEINLKLKPLVAVSSFKPLWLLKSQGKEAKIENKQKKWLSLIKQIQNLQKEAKMQIINDKIYDMEKPLKKQIEEETIARKCLEAKYQKLIHEMLAFLQELNSGYVVESSFTQFFPKTINDGKILAAELTIPDFNAKKSEQVKVEITLQQLQQLHSTLL
ncbi:dynactin subunit 1-like isoform X2 [Dinothrombium tinctorium]|uniref:Dynactin subunit 1 n=1 Tax=Dinothrombium tinctorium TaxID=1965070 RepID=A0A443R5R4_9ACAR|nr:dynactin subunit 1-like isoform X2 [Dinothrombium tinctorium]RWS10889.1 dynactin subunit 1-like isoform X2 [Dinothrombium tinctorium]